jgi:hypothetical protein
MVVCGAVLFALAGASAASAQDDFPITGTYIQNAPCKGDGKDPPALKVTISPQQIVSNIGVCKILNTKPDGKSLEIHVECKLPAGPMIGDITFTQLPDKTVKLVDSEGNYNAVLHRCPG